MVVCAKTHDHASAHNDCVTKCRRVSAVYVSMIEVILLYSDVLWCVAQSFSASLSLGNYPADVHFLLVSFRYNKHRKETIRRYPPLA